HRQAVHNLLTGYVACWCEDKHIVPRAQIRLFSDGLSAEVSERHLQLIERHPPPAFRLRRKPGMHERDTRDRSRVSLCGRLARNTDRREMELPQQRPQF